LPVYTWADGDDITAARLNTNLRDQVVSTVTSGTRPSGTEGQMCWETDTNRLILFDGTGWIGWDQDDQTYTPTLTASSVNPNLGSTGTITGRYRREGRMVTARISYTFGGSGISAGTGNYILLLPFDFDSNWNASIVGSCRIVNSGSRTVPAVCELNSTDKIVMNTTDDGSLVGAADPFAWGDTDTLNATVRYRMSNSDARL
jgi:hypothetical protein